MQLPASDAAPQPPHPSPLNPWVDHLGRVSYIRGHISLYATGVVLLLALDLLSGGGDVWADTVIGAWGILLIAHGLLAIMARLFKELLADEERAPSLQRPRPRPPWRSPEARWNVPSSWALPDRPDDTQSKPSPSPSSTAQATSPASEAPDAPSADPAPSPDDERVSWKEATKAAWLAPREHYQQGHKPSSSQKDDPNDFTPLKLD